MAFKKADGLVFWNGRRYFPQDTPGRQPDAELILSRRLGGQDLKDAAKAIITEDELRNFSQVYPRLYQVAERSQARLRAWVVNHKDTIQHWDLGDFFKPKAADILGGTKPRLPGCPPEVMKAWKSRTNLEGKKNLVVVSERPVDASGDCDVRMAPLTSKPHSFNCPDVMELPPIVYIQGLDTNVEDDLQKLGTALDTIKAAASRLEWLSGGLDNGNLIRKEMLNLAQKLQANVDGAERARHSISRHSNKATTSDRDRTTCGSGLVEGTGWDEDKDEDNDEDKGEDEGKVQRHAQVTHAQDSHSLKDAWDIDFEYGMFVSNPDEDAITTEYQTNHQGDGLAHSWLDLVDGPLEGEWRINDENGTFVSNSDEGAITTEYQTNYQGEGLARSWLDLIDGPLEGEWRINDENGTFVSNSDEGAITTEYQSNHQGGGPAHPLLSPIGGPIGTLDPQLDTGFLNLGQYGWESLIQYPGEELDNLMLDLQGFEQFIDPMALDVM